MSQTTFPGFREPARHERDALGVANSPALTLVANMAMVYLAGRRTNNAFSSSVEDAVNHAYDVLREIRRRGEALDAAAQAPTPPGKL